MGVWGGFCITVGTMGRFADWRQRFALLVAAAPAAAPLAACSWQEAALSGWHVKDNNIEQSTSTDSAAKLRTADERISKVQILAGRPAVHRGHFGDEMKFML